MPRTLLLAALLSAVGAALPFLGLVHAQGAAQGAATTPTPTCAAPRWARAPLPRSRPTRRQRDSLRTAAASSLSSAAAPSAMAVADERRRGASRSGGVRGSCQSVRQTKRKKQRSSSMHGQKLGFIVPRPLASPIHRPILHAHTNRFTLPQRLRRIQYIATTQSLSSFSTKQSGTKVHSQIKQSINGRSRARPPCQRPACPAQRGGRCRARPRRRRSRTRRWPGRTRRCRPVCVWGVGGVGVMVMVDGLGGFECIPKHERPRPCMDTRALMSAR